MTTTRLRGPVIDIAEATDTTERAFDDRLAQILWPWIDEDARPALDLCVTDGSVVAKVALHDDVRHRRVSHRQTTLNQIAGIVTVGSSRAAAPT